MILIHTFYADDSHYSLLPVKQKDIAKSYLIKKIKSHALGSLYLLNAKSADCYTFSCSDKDWSGGWDWSEHLVDKTCDYVFMLESKKFFKVSLVF